MKKYHLVATIDVLRHGEKNQSGDLTQKGFYQSAMKAIKIQHLDGDVYVYHSGNDRVKKTVLAVHDLIDREVEDVHESGFQKNILNHITERSLNEKTFIDNRLHFLFDPSKKGTYFSAWKPGLSFDELCKRGQDFLNLDDESPDPGIAPSPREMAQRLFSLILEQIKSVLNTPYHTRENFINGTHEPVLLSGVFYMLNYFKPGREDFVRHIGGTIDFTEGFHIKIFQRRNREYLLQFIFRNYMIDFSIDELESFIQEN